LNSGEIIEQIYHFARSLREEEAKITNIVFMGMGEPLLNYDEVCSAIHLLNDRKGFDFGLRRNTISTSGIIPGIYRMAEEHSQVNLAISLHTVNDALRTSLMPINKKYPIKDLFSACWAYTELTGRRITFEYALISGVNDSVEDARELVKSIRNRLCHVNLIPLNPTLGYRGVGSVSDQVQKFKLILEEAQIPVSVRLRRGIEIQAGCGQLASQQN
jgi:23S rRNA (adenine2503-C2)-methyltransferase